MDARRAKTRRSRGLVHDSCARRAELAILRIQGIPGILGTPGLQGESPLVFSDFFADFPNTARRSRRIRRH